VAALKREKTSEASAMAIKAAVKKTEEALKEVDVRARIQKIRRVFWWESATAAHTRGSLTLPCVHSLLSLRRRRVCALLTDL
jgi:hypothetical protein